MAVVSVTPKLFRTITNSHLATNIFQISKRSENDFILLNRSCRCICALQRSSFHFQNIIQIHIQTKHGILLDALQKNKASAAELNDFKIPDDLRRLKAGSLKWLYEVWPLATKSFIAFTEVEKRLPLKEDNTDKNSFKGQRGKTAKEEQLHRSVNYLKSRNVAIRRLLKLPWLLTIDPVILEKCVVRVQKLLGIENFQVAVSFVNVREMKLREVALVWNADFKHLSYELELIAKEEQNDVPVLKNRIDLIAYYLKCPPEDVSDMMAKVSKLMIIPVPQITSLLKCLLDAGVKPEAIISDPYVFMNNFASMRAKIQIVKKHGVTEFKPWLLRSPQRIFDSHIAKTLTEKQLLGDNENITGFLQEKLMCDEQMAVKVLERVPSIKKATAIKLNEMIEFLYSEGFAAEHILASPRILAHSVDTISERLQEISAYLKPMEKLQVLCRTSKDYRAIIRKLKKDMSASSTTLNHQSENPLTELVGKD